MFVLVRAAFSTLAWFVEWWRGVLWGNVLPELPVVVFVVGWGLFTPRTDGVEEYDADARLTFRLELELDFEDEVGAAFVVTVWSTPIQNATFESNIFGFSS